VRGDSYRLALHFAAYDLRAPDGQEVRP